MISPREEASVSKRVARDVDSQVLSQARPSGPSSHCRCVLTWSIGPWVFLGGQQYSSIYLCSSFSIIRTVPLCFRVSLCSSFTVFMRQCFLNQRIISSMTSQKAQLVVQQCPTPAPGDLAVVIVIEYSGGTPEEPDQVAKKTRAKLCWKEDHQGNIWQPSS